MPLAKCYILSYFIKVMLKIKQTITFLAIVLIVSVGITISLKTPSYAAECGGVETSIIDCDQTGCKNNEPTDADGKCPDGSEPDLENTGLWGLLMLVINILTAGIGIAAVGGIIYGSILYTTSGGNADQVKKALQIIRDVVIGLLMYVLMYAFLNYIVPGGMFN